MLKLDGRSFLALLLSVLLLYPSPMTAGTTASRNVLGSIAARGSVQVGEVLMPTEGTLFAGDRVQTNNGSAIIQYREGARIQLASGSLANFTPSRVQLEKGLMSFQTASNNGMMFAVSTLRLEPSTPKAAANVTLKDSKASVAVTEGTLKIVDPSGAQLASLNAGDARLFEEVAASLPEPAASPSPAPAAAAPPQGGGGGSHTWMIALGAAVVGTSLGIAGLVRANDANDRADQSISQVAALQTQIAAAQAQVTTLRAQLATLAAQSAQVKAIEADLAAQLQALATLQQQLAAGQITPAAAAARLAQINAAISASINALAQITFSSPSRLP